VNIVELVAMSSHTTCDKATLKDFSFDVKPADMDGLAELVDRYQVDKKAQHMYMSEPY